MKFYNSIIDENMNIDATDKTKKRRMQRLRDPAAEHAGRASPMLEIMRNLLRLNKYLSRKAIFSKNEQSEFLENVERSSIDLTTFVGSVALDATDKTKKDNETDVRDAVQRRNAGCPSPTGET